MMRIKQVDGKKIKTMKMKIKQWMKKKMLNNMASRV